MIDLVKEFKSFNCNVDVYDPWVNKNQAAHEYKIEPIDKPIKGKYDAIVIAVAHDEFKSLTEDQIRALVKIIMYCMTLNIYLKQMNQI